MTDSGATPTSTAGSIQFGHVDVLELLGMAMAAVDKGARRPFSRQLAAATGDARKLWVQAKVGVTRCRHSDGWSPLFVAAGVGNPQVVWCLLGPPAVVLLSTTAAAGCTVFGWLEASRSTWLVSCVRDENVARLLEVSRRRGRRARYRLQAATTTTPAAGSTNGPEARA